MRIAYETVRDDGTSYLVLVRLQVVWLFKSGPHFILSKLVALVFYLVIVPGIPRKSNHHRWCRPFYFCPHHMVLSSAQVTILNISAKRLSVLEESLEPNQTLMSNSFLLKQCERCRCGSGRCLSLVPKAPGNWVTKDEMVKQMRPGSVIVDSRWPKWHYRDSWPCDHAMNPSMKNTVFSTMPLQISLVRLLVLQPSPNQCHSSLYRSIGWQRFCTCNLWRWGLASRCDHL